MGIGMIDLKKFNPHSHPKGGETMVIEMGDTEVILEYTAENRDIRICDGDSIVKVRLNEDCSIRDALKNDRFMRTD